jgi:hypothetical protein
MFFVVVSGFYHPHSKLANRGWKRKKFAFYAMLFLNIFVLNKLQLFHGL